MSRHWVDQLMRRLVTPAPQLSTQIEFWSSAVRDDERGLVQVHHEAIAGL